MGWMENKRPLYLLATVAILAIALIFYLYNFKGINIDSDDFSNAYLAANPGAIKTCAVGAACSGILGMVAVGMALYPFFHNNLFFPSAVGIIATLLTIAVIFLIGREYGKPSMGFLAATLYAFNPLVYTYAPHFLPENFIVLLLSISLLLLLKANKSENPKRAAFEMSSGFAIGLMIFFGVQSFIAMLAYGVMILALALHERHWEKILYAFVGASLALWLYFIVATAVYQNPLGAISYASRDAQLSGTFGHKPFPYYLYVVLPVFTQGADDFWSIPVTNLGVLFVLFVLSCAVFLYRTESSAEKEVKYGGTLPYATAGIAFVLYLMFGTDSLNSYRPMLELNRLALPVVLLFALSVALSVSLIKRNRVRRVVFVAIVVVNSLVTLYYVTTLSTYYTRYQTSYDSIISLNAHMQGVNLTRYVFYNTFASMPVAPCFALGVLPKNCWQLLNVTKANLSKSNQIFVVGAPLAGNSTYYYNSTYRYYIYIEN